MLWSQFVCRYSFTSCYLFQPVERGRNVKRPHFLSNANTALQFLQSKKVKVIYQYTRSDLITCNRICSIYIKFFHLVFQTFPSLVWRLSSFSLAFNGVKWFLFTPLLLLCSCSCIQQELCSIVVANNRKFLNGTLYSKIVIIKNILVSSLSTIYFNKHSGTEQVVLVSFAFAHWEYVVPVFTSAILGTSKYSDL